jgi:hypothetical protein
MTDGIGRRQRHRQQIWHHPPPHGPRRPSRIARTTSSAKASVTESIHGYLSSFVRNDFASGSTCGKVKSFPTDRKDRRAVLPRDREHANSRIASDHPVEERYPHEPPRRRAHHARSDQRRRRVRYSSVVRDDPRMHGLAPRQYRRMPGRRLGHRMILPRVWEERRACPEARQSAGELRSKAA